LLGIDTQVQGISVSHLIQRTRQSKQSDVVCDGCRIHGVQVTSKVVRDV
jgi:hypothetical protein